MRKVFEHPAFHEVGLCESILKSHGIATAIRNQAVSSLIGEIPFAAAYPELWVCEDSEYEVALGVLRDYHDAVKQDAGGADWKCPACGEQVPGTFSSCWNCEHAKSDQPA